MNNILPINKVICGDAIEHLKIFPDNYFDSIVTDPPAGIEFMGKEWDSFKNNKRSKGWSQQNKEGGDTFGGFGKKLMPSFYNQTKKDRDNFISYISGIMAEGLRVLKPGGHALVWALPRTSHWTAMALEDAGFEIRDCIYHVFGSGFPKSLNIGKAIDKFQGNEREDLGEHEPFGREGRNGSGKAKFGVEGWETKPKMHLTKGTTEWEGYGTALKPAVECWWLVRKPISEDTVAENVLKWGVGGINIEACRVHTTIEEHEKLNDGRKSNRTIRAGEVAKGFGMKPEGLKDTEQSINGRFPANFIHDGSDEVLAEFPHSKSGAMTKPYKYTNNGFSLGKPTGETKQIHDSNEGSASRFFYCAKPSRSERDNGLTQSIGTKRETPMAGRGQGGLKCEVCGKWKNSGSPCICANPKFIEVKFDSKPNMNNHPTVKSQALMEYLIKLITPPNSIGLDMFAGSGSTLIAYKKLGHRYIGIEIDPEYCKIAEQRLIADLNGNRSLDAYNEYEPK
jgi:site-specific DNA-methyltransferase (adenine-specific)